MLLLTDEQVRAIARGCRMPDSFINQLDDLRLSPLLANLVQALTAAPGGLSAQEA
jgi:hypothetical protein